MKKYLYVPIMLSTVTELSRPVIFRQLHDAGAQTVFLAISDIFSPTKTEGEIERLKGEIELFVNEGFEVGVWINSFGFGIPLDADGAAYAKKHKWKKITGFWGMKVSAFCPTDENFRAYYATILNKIAEAGAKTILLDDDFCLSIRPDVGCSCKNHSKLFRKATCLPLPGPLLTTLSVFGKPGKLRKKWLAVMGDSLRDFAKVMRKSLDEKFPDVRMGLCAGYTSWDWEGADAYEIARLLAGENKKPLLRLTGAPYWIYTRRFGAQDLATIVECARMQLAWLRDKEVEVFAEDDSYPRPSYHVPACLIESFDTVMRAQGECGDLKYMFDYFMEPETENAYLEAHNKTLRLYDRIDKLFEGKREEGVRIYEYADKAAHSHTSPMGLMLEKTFFSRAATMLANAGIPTVYAGDGCGVCFGMNAVHLPKESLKKGFILDYPAALYLTLQGCDVGLPTISGKFFDLLKRTPKLSSSREIDEKSGRVNSIFNNPGGTLVPILPAAQTLYRLSPKEGAEILSRYDDGSPSSYLYENKEGERFMVLAFDASTLPFDSDLLLSYARSAQMKRAIPYLQRKPLSAYVEGNISGVYLLTKREGDLTAVGVWNMRPDVASFFVKVDGFCGLVDAPEEVTEAENGFRVNQLAAYGCVFLSLKTRNR